MDIPWTGTMAERWLQQQRQDRVPHAVMLLGAAGVGKRCAAAWLAQCMLRGDSAPALPQYPPAPVVHPDLHRLVPLPDKQSIGVDQVRELVAELSLTSHDGGGKVAIVDPANAMTANAANSLLKTLEEPPGRALIVLVADRNGWLPATVFSRCQRIVLRLPAEREALAWLDRVQPGASWHESLRQAGGAPLAAIDARERLEETAAMARDLAAVAGRTRSPVDVAGQWTKLGPDRVLNWLVQQVQCCIRRQNAGGAVTDAAVLPDSVLQRIDSRNLFCYLDRINRLRGQAAGSFNVQLTFESLLIDWAEGLAACRTTASGAEQSLLFGAR